MMKKRLINSICLVLSLVMMCVSYTPIAAADDTVITDHTNECTEHIHEEDVESENSPRSLNPICLLNGHDFSGPKNFSGYHIIHTWNNTDVCKIFYYDNVTCSRFLCGNTGDIITDEGIIDCTAH